MMLSLPPLSWFFFVLVGLVSDQKAWCSRAPERMLLSQCVLESKYCTFNS